MNEFEQYSKQARRLLSQKYSLLKTKENREDAEANAILEIYQAVQEGRNLSTSDIDAIVKQSIRTAFGDWSRINWSKRIDERDAYTRWKIKSDNQESESDAHQEARRILSEAVEGLSPSELILYELRNSKDEDGNSLTFKKIGEKLGLKWRTLGNKYIAIRSKVTALVNAATSQTKTETSKKVEEKIEAYGEAGISREHVLNFPHLLIPSAPRIKEIILELKGLGHSDEEIQNIAKTNFSVFGTSGASFRQKMSVLRRIGHTDEEIRQLARNGRFYSLSAKKLKRVQDFLKRLGYTRKEIREVGVRSNPYLYSLDRLQRIADVYQKWGYSPEEFRELIRKHAGFFIASSEKHWDSHAILRGQGHTTPEVRALFFAQPTLIGASEHRVVAFYDRLKEFGLTARQACRVMSKTPALFWQNPFKGKEFHKRLSVTQEARMSPLDNPAWLIRSSVESARRIKILKTLRFDYRGDHKFLLDYPLMLLKQLPGRMKKLERKGHSPRDVDKLVLPYQEFNNLRRSPFVHPQFETMMRRYALEHGVRFDSRAKLFLRDYFSERAERLPYVLGGPSSQVSTLEGIAQRHLPRAFRVFKRQRVA